MPSTGANYLPFKKPGVVDFTDHEGGLISINVTTPQAAGRLYLHGAHVTHWQPAGYEPVIFLSEKSAFVPGKAIRGGVPIIFPWFGAKEGDPSAPQHGFARTQEWVLVSVDHEVDLGVSIVLRLADSVETKASWPHPFTAEYRVTFGRLLHTMLKVENRAATAIRFEEALHTYLAVSDIEKACVHGLDGATYLDKVDGGARKTLAQDPLRFTGETDRVFLKTTASLHLDDPGHQRRITVEKTGSASTVVWNPWIVKARWMPDFGEDEWRRMVCLETANAADDAVVVEPGAVHTLTTDISV
ncbi:MAG: D-hexose-6-phosphate mutarotase, partial [Chthoniobacteraceae bacterium]